VGGGAVGGGAVGVSLAGMFPLTSLVPPFAAWLPLPWVPFLKCLMPLKALVRSVVVRDATEEPAPPPAISSNTTGISSSTTASTGPYRGGGDGGDHHPPQTRGGGGGGGGGGGDHHPPHTGGEFGAESLHLAVHSRAAAGELGLAALGLRGQVLEGSAAAGVHSIEGAAAW
jgi:hypothetical protein